MIVLDASAAVEVLIAENPPPSLVAEFANDLHSPAHVDLEVMSVMRGLTLANKLTPTQAEFALAEFHQIPLTRHPFEGLSARAWALRHQFTTYDAAYLALAEALNAPLLTCDAKLATRGHHAQVLLAR